jgi:phosphate transport system substrate-binding protein
MPSPENLMLKSNAAAKMVALVTALTLGVAQNALAASISGAGATFPAPVYAKWAEQYKAATQNDLNYQAIGSGGGIKQINASTVDFGASDKPLKPDVLATSGLQQFPTVVGGVVPVINVPGLQAGQLHLTGKVLARAPASCSPPTCRWKTPCGRTAPAATTPSTGRRVWAARATTASPPS